MSSATGTGHNYFTFSRGFPENSFEFLTFSKDLSRQEMCGALAQQHGGAAAQGNPTATTRAAAPLSSDSVLVRIAGKVMALRQA